MSESKPGKFIRPSIFNNSPVDAIFTTNTVMMTKDVAGVLNVAAEKIYCPVQKHTDKIQILEDDFNPAVADAVITDRQGVVIGVKVADCVPVLLYDRKRKVAGAVHAGWRGTAGQILKKTLNVMSAQFGSSPLDIITAVGPCIRECCYSVGEDVREALLNTVDDGSFGSIKKEKCCIDLASINIEHAISLGVDRHNIWKSEECTSCNPDRFYSYRYARGTTGRQGGFIIMW
jgi:YfiH family protein